MGRAYVEDLHIDDVPETAGSGAFTDARWRVLSADDEDGAVTAYTTLPPGFTGTPPAGRAYEFLVLRGSMAANGLSVATGHYGYLPPESDERTLTSDEGALILLVVGNVGMGSGDPMVVDPDTVPWKVSVHENVPENGGRKIVNMAKLLRVDAETKDTTGLSAMAPGTSQDCAEWHASADEGFMLRGDMLCVRPDGGPARMVVGTYNWRPGNVRHLPKYTHTGNLRFFRASGAQGWSDTLHYAEHPGWAKMLEEYRSQFTFYGTSSEPDEEALASRAAPSGGRG